MPELEELDPLIFGSESPCFGCSPAHPIGFHLRFWRAPDHILTRFTPDSRLQGPPGIMHGGLVATLADELAAWTIVGLKRRFGFTASMSARLAKPVRIGVEVVGRGRIVRETPRIQDVAIELEQQQSTVFTGDFRFVVLDEQGAERLLGGPLPEAWKRFARDSASNMPLTPEGRDTRGNDHGES